MKEAIAVENIAKRFADVEAVNDISFRTTPQPFTLEQEAIVTIKGCSESTFF